MLILSVHSGALETQSVRGEEKCSLPDFELKRNQHASTCNGQHELHEAMAEIETDMRAPADNNISVSKHTTYIGAGERGEQTN